MILKIEEIADFDECEIIIKHNKNHDVQVENLIKYLNKYLASVVASKDGANYKIALNLVYYIDCVDNSTYLYLNDGVYECDLKLYQLEDKLENTSFVRIGKSTIVNIDYLQCVKTLLNGKLEVLLLNDEKLIVNRSYVSSFRQKFGI